MTRKKHKIVKTSSSIESDIVGITKVEAILKIKKVVGGIGKVSHAVISVDDSEWEQTNKIKTQNLDVTDDVTDGNDFDSIYDIIGRELFK